MWAAAENHGAAIKALVARGADMNARSKELSFPEYRYETNGMAVFQLPEGGWTALMYAARQNAMEAVAALADVARRSQRDDEPGRHDGAAIAIINIHYDLANLLLETAAPIPNVADSTRHDGALRGRRHARAGEHADPAGAEAARHARRASGIVKSLLAHGANPERPAQEADHRPASQSVGDGLAAEGATALARAAKTVRRRR